MRQQGPAGCIHPSHITEAFHLHHDIGLDWLHLETSGILGVPHGAHGGAWAPTNPNPRYCDFFSFRFYDRFRNKTNHIKPVLKDQKRNEIMIFHTFPHIFPPKSGGFPSLRYSGSSCDDEGARGFEDWLGYLSNLAPQGLVRLPQ